MLHHLDSPNPSATLPPMAGAPSIGIADGGCASTRGLPLERPERKGGEPVNKELRRILAGASIATLVAGAGIGGLGCAKRAHGS